MVLEALKPERQNRGEMEVVCRSSVVQGCAEIGVKDGLLVD
jgi:hypothetical protein